MLRQAIISTRGQRAWQGIPGIERAGNGRLWCVAYTGGPREPDPANCLWLSTSGDAGTTWTAPETVVDPAGATRAYDPCLWHDPDGRLWLIYNQANLETNCFSLWALIASDSHEPEPHWSELVRIQIDAPFAVRLNKPIVLSDGAWLLTVTYAKRAPQEGWFPREDQLQGVAISRDRGATWALHGAVTAPPWALENMVVELSDGRTWMLIRTGAGVLWQSFSQDGGFSWCPGEPSAIVNPGSRFFIRRLASGRLLLVNTPRAQGRVGLTASLSAPDDEMTFGRGLELDARDKVSYPDAVQAPDGVIYAVHDCDRQGLGEIHLSVFGEPDIPV